MADNVIYGKEHCPYTTAARDDLDQRGVPFQYVDVEADAAAMERMLALTGGRRQVPVIVADGQVTVGFGGT
jgi:glutaredoxin 3